MSIESVQFVCDNTECEFSATDEREATTWSVTVEREANGTFYDIDHTRCPSCGQEGSEDD